MKHIKMYENFLFLNKGRHLQHQLSLNEARRRFDPETGTYILIPSRGERVALARGENILEDEQLFGAYLRALDEYKGQNYIDKIPGIDKFKKKNKEEKISDLDLAIALNYDKLDTFILDKNKFISFMKGDRSYANRIIDEKRLEIFDLLQEFEPEQIISAVSDLVQNTNLPRNLNKERYVKPLENKNILNYIEEYIRAKKENKDRTTFITFPGDEKWMRDLAPVIDRAAERYNRDSDEIIAIYQEKIREREKSMAKEREKSVTYGRRGPARKYY
jgi:hypothetical protein